MARLRVYKSWASSRYHEQYSAPDSKWSDGVIPLPYIDTVRGSRRGTALRQIIEKLFIMNKQPISKRHSGGCGRGRPPKDERITWNLTPDEETLFIMLAEVVRDTYQKRKIFEELVPLSPEEIKHKIALMSMMRGKTHG